MAVTPNVSRDLGCMISEFVTGEAIEPVAPVALAA
jgi:DNA (cytosine-5)-methyltransferase 1